MKSYHIIGLMSGTSLDGLDVAHVRFTAGSNEQWNFDILGFHTYPYEVDLVNKLNKVFEMSALGAFEVDKSLGSFYADCVNDFMAKNNIKKSQVDAIACHGQTIFHQPDKGLTVQIGCGETLAFQTGIKVINDFRKKDVLAGGQGAPLVPIGDFALFSSKAESFLNIGGIANISFKLNDKIVAFDICPGNLPLNKLANAKGMSYDQNGMLARSGELNFFLLDLLNELDYYKQESPKSLGVEWLEQDFFPLIKFDKDIENNLRTVIEHEAIQIADILNQHALKSVFVTGGGAFNSFLMERIKHYFKGEVILPEALVIEAKEALVFAFLGVLYLEGKINSLASVTGANYDVRGGVLHVPA